MSAVKFLSGGHWRTLEPEDGTWTQYANVRRGQSTMSTAFHNSFLNISISPPNELLQLKYDKFHLFNKCTRKFFSRKFADISGLSWTGKSPRETADIIGISRIFAASELS